MRIRSASILLVIAVEFCTISGAVSNAIHTVDSTSDDVGEKKHVNGFLRGDKTTDDVGEQKHVNGFLTGNKTAHADDDEDEDDEERATAIIKGVYHDKAMTTKYLKGLVKNNKSTKYVQSLLFLGNPSKEDLLIHPNAKAFAKFMRLKLNQGTSSKTPIIVNNEELDKQTAKTLFASKAAWDMDILGAEAWLGLSNVPRAQRTEHPHWRAFQLFKKTYLKHHKVDVAFDTGTMPQKEAIEYLKREALAGVSFEKMQEKLQLKSLPPDELKKHSNSFAYEMYKAYYRILAPARAEKKFKAAEAKSKDLDEAFQQLLVKIQQAKEAESVADLVAKVAATRAEQLKDAISYADVFTARTNIQSAKWKTKTLEKELLDMGGQIKEAAIAKWVAKNAFLKAITEAEDGAKKQALAAKELEAQP